MITTNDAGARRPAAQAAPARDGPLGPRAPQRHRRRLRDLSGARLELPHDRHAGGARACASSRRSTRSSPSGGARPSATPRRSRSCPYLEVPYEPDDAVRTWQSYAVRVSARRPGRPHRADAPAAARRRRDAPRVMAIHHEAAYEGADVLLPAHRGRSARGADAAAVPGPRGRRSRTTSSTGWPPTWCGGRPERDARAQHGSWQRHRRGDAPSSAPIAVSGGRVPRARHRRSPLLLLIVLAPLLVLIALVDPDRLARLGRVPPAAARPAPPAVHRQQVPHDGAPTRATRPTARSCCG